MNTKVFGDSYDIVKKFLVQSLAPDAEWVAFPMFHDEFDPDKIQKYEHFLRVHVISKTVIKEDTNHIDYLAASDHHRHVFIDPDTGIMLEPTKGVDSTKYIFGRELVKLCQDSRKRLLLVFDKSVQRGKEREQIKNKLQYFRDRNICGFAYVSHACFVVLSASNSACLNAYNCLLESGLPISKLYPENAKQIALLNSAEPLY